MSKYTIIDGSRILILPTLTSDTPSSVILEIADSMRYKVDSSLTNNNYINGLWEGINNYTGIDLSVDLKTLEPEPNYDNMSNVAKLVSSDVQEWPLDALLIAFKHLMEFHGVLKTNKLDRRFTVGKKTPSNPLTYDVCMLYKICLHFNVPTTRATTIEEMEEIARLCLTPRIELINMIVNKSRTPKWVPNESLVTTSYDSLFCDREVIYKMYKPTTHAEAVLMAKKIYNVNIYMADNPMQEYQHMMNVDSSKYEPRDNNMKTLMKRDPRWIDTNVNWMAPLLQYSNVKLREFATLEGFKRREDLKAPLESLNELSEKNHIYIGIHPYVDLNTTSTLIYQYAIEDVPSNDFVLTIGKTSEPKSLYLLTVSELGSFFESKGLFCLPHNPRYYFNDITISKLQTFCETNIQRIRYDSSQSLKDSPLLTLDRALKYINIQVEEVFTHIDKIKNLHETDKVLVESYLVGVMELAFYMRGWKIDGNDEYPLKTCQTQSMDDAIDSIELNYNTQHIKIYEMYNECVDELQDIIDGIYLMLKKDVDNKNIFVKSSSTEIGITLMERISIVKDNDNDNACIRLSSNYILYSVWFYMKECFDKEMFDVNDVDVIS